MLRRITLAATTLALMLACASTALATTPPRYASPTGTAGQDCTTPATACDIATAIDGDGGSNNPLAGQEVILEPGTYALTATLAPTVNTIIHGAAGQPRPVIQASGFAALYPSSAFGLQISDVEFDIHTGNGDDSIDTSGATFDRVVIKGDSGPGNLCQCYDGTIRNSVIIDTAPTGSAWGINSNGGTSTETLRNDTFIATQAGAYAIWVSVYNNPAQPTTIDAKNVIAINTAGGNDVYSYGPKTTITLADSNYAAPLTGSGGTITDGGNNQASPPVFFDRDGGDLREKATSPTIDHGSDDPPTDGTLDLAGNPREAGSHTDIGAFEYQPPAAIAPSGSGVASAAVAQPFGGPLGAKVTDAQGNPVPDITVTFHAPSSGATGTFPGDAVGQAITGADGVAVMPAFTASQRAGSFSVTASIAEIAGTAQIPLTNIPGPAATLTLAPMSSSAQAGQPRSYAIEAFDAFANDAGAASGSHLTVTPDGSCDQLACSALKPGTHTVTATLGSAHGSATLIVTPLPPVLRLSSRPAVTVTPGSRRGRMAATCRAPASETCVVNGTLTVRAHKRLIKIGVVRGRLPAATAGTLLIKLSKTGIAHLTRRRRAANARLSITDLSGAASLSRVVKLSLSARAHRGR